jgi:hypothetical protein
MKVKAYTHGQGFDPCKGGRGVQNARVKVMETVRHDGSKFMSEKACCRYCKRWVCFDYVKEQGSPVVLST